MDKRYYTMDVSPTEADIVIFGDITSWDWDEKDTSSWGLSKQLAALPDTVGNINVHINSYGGEVAEGLAIHNALKAHPANVTTMCEGFACSIASVIFMAGDVRIMDEASLLLIHNASNLVWGTADEMRKGADDLDTITNQSKKIYLAATDLTEEEVTEMMDAETFIEADYAVEHGFATQMRPVAKEASTQDARQLVARRLTRSTAKITMKMDYGEIMRKVGERLIAEYPESAPDATHDVDPDDTPPDEGGEGVPEEADDAPPEQTEKEPEDVDEPVNRLVSFLQAITKED